MLKMTYEEYLRSVEVRFDCYMIELRVGRWHYDNEWDEYGGARLVWSSLTFDVPAEDQDSRLLLRAVIEKKCPPSILADRLQEVYNADGLAAALRHPDLA
jgi:hypothetical protein